MKNLEAKIYPPIVCIATAIIMYLAVYGFEWPTFPSNLQIVVASIVFWVGVIVVVTAVQGFRGAATTLHPVKISKASTLVSSGIFSWSRNPMYLGMALVLVAWTILLGSYWSVIGPAVFVIFITRFQIMPEERALLKVFGQTYSDYCARVRRWI